MPILGEGQGGDLALVTLKGGHIVLGLDVPDTNNRVVGSCPEDEAVRVELGARVAVLDVVAGNLAQDLARVDVQNSPGRVVGSRDKVVSSGMEGHINHLVLVTLDNVS